LRLANILKVFIPSSLLLINYCWRQWKLSRQSIEDPIFSLDKRCNRFESLFTNFPLLKSIAEITIFIHWFEGLVRKLFQNWNIGFPIKERDFQNFVPRVDLKLNITAFRHITSTCAYDANRLKFKNFRLWQVTNYISNYKYVVVQISFQKYMS